MKQSPVLELMVVVVNRGKGEEVTKTLTRNGAKAQIICLGEGTAESEVANFFGFGTIERDVVLALVDYERSAKALERISKKFKFDKRHNGLGFTVPLQSAGMGLIKHLKIDLGGTKE